MFVCLYCEAMSVNLYVQCLLGLGCKEFAMVAADQTQIQSIIILKSDAQKLFELSDNIVMGVNGEFGDIAQLTHFVKQNIALYRTRNRYGLGARAAVHFTRKNMIEAINDSTPYTVNLILGGYDREEGGQVFSIDYLGSCIQVPYCAHGFGGMLCSSIFDMHYTPNLTEGAAYELLVMCINEIQKRLVLNLTNFQVKIIDCNGVRDLPTISAPRIL